MQLSFIQANWQRCYPFIFIDGQEFMDSNNNVVPMDLVVGLRITISPAEFGSIYINHIYTNNYNVSISFASPIGDLGYANGTITDDNQSLTIYDYLGGVRGNVVIGNQQSTLAQQSFTFTSGNGSVEPSTVLVLPLPPITNIQINGKGPGYTGNINFTSSTLNIDAGANLVISAMNPSTITSRGDKLAEYLTCVNPVISGINTVTPDKNGNINIFSIDPVRITQPNSPAGPIIFNVNGLVMDENSTTSNNLCTLTISPPINPSNTYGELTTTPEWKNWPQFTLPT